MGNFKLHVRFDVKWQRVVPPVSAGSVGGGVKMESRITINLTRLKAVICFCLVGAVHLN